MKWPRKKAKGMKGIHPHLVIMDEIHEYGNLDRMDGLGASIERHPSSRGTWHDWTYYEEKHGRGH